MADPSTNVRRWLWPVLIALLAILLLIVLLDPTGDRDGSVEDPIVTGEIAEEPAGAGPGLPGEGAPDPGTPQEVEEAAAAGGTADTQPAEAVPVPPPAPVGQ